MAKERQSSNDVLKELLDFVGVEDIRILPESVMSILLGEDELRRQQLFRTYLELHRDSATGRIDLSRELMSTIYEKELSERKEKKQDFTPREISELCAQLTFNGPGVVHEPTAGNGSMLISYWHEGLMKTRIRDYKPSNHTVYCWELSSRSLPILLLNLAVRGIMGVVVHGDVLEKKVQDIYFLDNERDDFLAFSRVMSMHQELGR
ncbi:MAG: N-6 DNA methylase [Porphyromonas sp.]|nr:N-6 DNA methylase [Porphyromonas sp.]